MRQTRSTLNIVGFSLLLCLFFVCVFPQKADADFQKTKIAVLDFVLYGDKLETPGMGAILSEWFITSIVKSGRFDVVERAMLQKIISEQKLATTGLIDESSATELGKILGVKVIITGSVLKLRNTVEINSRVISVESGSIIAAENIRGGSNSDLQLLVELLTRRIIRNFPLTGYIVKKSPTSVIIDLGLTAGLDAGTEFIVYKEGEVIKHPKTGEVLDVEQIHTGRIRITRVRRNVAEGLILSEKSIGIAYGQMVQSTQLADAVQSPPPGRQQKKKVTPPKTTAKEKVTLKQVKRKIVAQPESPPQPPPQPLVQSEQITLQTAAPRPKILNVAIFPWRFTDDANRFSSYLVDGINYRIEDSDKLELKKSYYRIKRIPKLNIPGSPGFYHRGKPDISRVREVSREQNIHIAILGEMDIFCKWSDDCQVRQMEIIFLDTTTGDIVSEKTFASVDDARDLIDSTISKAFRKFNRNLNSD